MTSYEALFLFVISAPLVVCLLAALVFALQNKGPNPSIQVENLSESAHALAEHAPDPIAALIDVADTIDLDLDLD